MLNLKVSSTSRQSSLRAVADTRTEAVKGRLALAKADLPVRSGWSMGWLTQPMQRMAQAALTVGRRAPAVAAVTLALSMGATGAMAQVPAGAPLEPVAAIEAPAQTQTQAPRTYVVKRGDSLEKIATAHGTTVDALLQLNNIRYKNLIYPKQVLRLPVEADVDGANVYQVRRGDSIARIAARLGIDAQVILDANHLPNPNRIVPGQYLVVPGAAEAAPAAVTHAPEAEPSVQAPATYTVRRGDVLEHIARDVGVPMTHIAKLNKLRAPYIIHPGQVLKLREAPAAPQTVAPELPAPPAVAVAPTAPAADTVVPLVPAGPRLEAPDAQSPQGPQRAPAPQTSTDATVRSDARLEVVPSDAAATAGIAHLSAADQKIFTEAQPRLHWGVDGHAVQLVQAQLTRLGYPLGTADGAFGSKTRSAVRAFQVFNGIRGDGIVGASTWEALASADAVRLPTDGVYEVRSVYRPYTAEAYRLFLRAAADEGLPADWAIADSLHRVIDAESDGEVGRPNYTYGWRANTPSEWPKIHAELQRGRITAKSSATGIGQLLLSNVELHYPSKRAGINVPLEEARGMLSYIKARHHTPDNAWRNYNSVHEGY